MQLLNGTRGLTGHYNAKVSQLFDFAAVAPAKNNRCNAPGLT